MVKIVRHNGTREQIDSLKYGGNVRPYLGMSKSGEPCPRKRWYGFHWVDLNKHTSKMERVFTIGHEYEKIAIAQLKEIGIEVYKIVDGKKIEIFGNKNETQEEFVGFASHSKGHPDGRCINVPEAPKTEHLLEIKTMQQKYFIPVTKKGIQKANLVYYGQCQRYMHYMKLKRCLFVVINKNTAELYIERINYDPGIAKDLEKAEQDIILAVEPPVKRWLQSDYHCHSAMCEFRNICHGSDSPEKNCRTCKFSDLENNGKWSCDYHNKNISTKKQKKGCEHWQIGWSL